MIKRTAHVQHVPQLGRPIPGEFPKTLGYAPIPHHFHPFRRVRFKVSFGCKGLRVLLLGHIPLCPSKAEKITWQKLR